MWEPRPLIPLWAFTACYRDSFTLLFYFLLKSRNKHRTTQALISRRRIHITYWQFTFCQSFILSVHYCVLRLFFQKSKTLWRCNLLKYILSKQRVSEYYYYCCCCYYYIFFHSIIVGVITLMELLLLSKWLSCLVLSYHLCACACFIYLFCSWLLYHWPLGCWSVFK
jgi:hypothetical protein